jgi:predicted PurR-regulated permease PerM
MATNSNMTGLKQQLVFFLIIFALFVLFLMVFHTILLPFIAGMALAYSLDPVADWFQRHGFSRIAATSVILISFLVLFVLALVIIIPILASQASGFIAKIPDYVSQLQQLVADGRLNILPKWLTDQIGTIKENSAKLLSEGAGFIGSLLGQIWDSGVALLDILSLVIVTPVVAFYLLLDWDRMVEKVDSWIPRDYVSVVREIGSEINRTIGGFVRGQGSLCLILGLYYGIGLTLTGLNFGLLIGLFTGLISFIPYVGSVIGLVLALGLALVQFWPDYTMVLIVLAIFFSGQFLEGNILQPKLVGNSVGLHPVWLMFALFAFGLLFGFVGLLVAVPAAACVGVLVRFALNRYLDSELYSGLKTETPQKPTGMPE